MSDDRSPFEPPGDPTDGRPPLDDEYGFFTPPPTLLERIRQFFAKLADWFRGA